MSMNGSLTAELEFQRLEQLRLGQARMECRTIAAACKSQIAAISDPVVAQLAAPNVKRIQQLLSEAFSQADEAPDIMLGSMQEHQRDLCLAIAEAEAKASNWSKEQAASKARVDEIRAKAEATRQISHAPKAALDELDKKVAEASALHNAGRLSEAETACKAADSLAQSAHDSAFDETVRREVVRGLLATLLDMGFTVDGPRVAQADEDAGTVTLVGRLPSGKQARFDIAVDGRMTFDLDGYEGNSCGDHLKQVQESLQKRFSLKLGPPQVTWKNPDRISKGSRDLPGGDAHRTAAR